MRSLLLLAVLAAPAAAADAKPAPDPKHEAAEDKARTVPGGASLGIKSCHDDLERFCAKVKPGKGRLGACLQRKARKLSAPCRDWLKHGGRGHVDRAFTELDPAPEAKP